MHKNIHLLLLLLWCLIWKFIKVTYAKNTKKLVKK